MSNTCILTLDQGTTSSRALVVRPTGEIVATAQKELEQHFPRPGWVEHDPVEIWEAQAEVASEAMEAAGVTAADVAAIGITDQRETTIVWERSSGRPIANAIVWQDRRTAGICDRLREAGHEPLIQERTGLVVDAYFSATKVQWLLDNVDGARARAEAGELAFGTIDAWLIYNLTRGAVHATDISNASRTMLYDIRRQRWDDELCDLLRVPASLLPEVVPSSGEIAVAGDGTFAPGTPVAGVAGDQQAALFGQLCTTSGEAKNTYGTGCFVLMNTGTEAFRSANRLVSTVAWERDGRVDYALEGSIFVAGAAVQWLRDGLGLIADATEVEALARSVPDAGGVFVVPAFTGLGAPHWDPYARGTIVGLTRGSTAAHVARATLEAIALQVVDVLDAMAADSGIELTELRVDGGAAADDLLLQIQADLLGVPVVRPRMLETTAMGAAYLAGLGVGVWESTDDIASHLAVDRVFEPSIGRDEADAKRAGWRRALERARGWERE